MDDDIWEAVIRKGQVSSINAGMRTARVIFPALGGMVSGDLQVLHHAGAPVAVEETELTYKGETKKHTHEAALLGWMPAVGSWVLCLCLPGEDGAGFVLGGL